MVRPATGEQCGVEMQRRVGGFGHG
jgi:hypothetical protein